MGLPWCNKQSTGIHRLIMHDQFMVFTSAIFIVVLCDFSILVNAISCSHGTFALFNSTYTDGVCLSCAPGTYLTMSESNYSRSCIPCQPGTYSPQKASSCTNCPPNSWASCPAGTYGDCLGDGSPNCTVCAAGLYSNSTGASACQACMSGTFSSLVGSNSSAACTICQTGTYSDRSGSSVCTNCSTCTIGQYNVSNCISSANIMCVNCTNPVVSTQASRVIFTGVGTAGPQSCSFCCHPGTWFSSSGAYGGYFCVGIGIIPEWAFCGVRYSCPANSRSYIVSAGTQTACTCNAGFTGVGGWNTTWQNFPLGTQLQPPANWSGVNCEACPIGKYNTGTGVTSSSQCISCVAGSYSTVLASANSSSCLSCQAGMYSSFTAVSSSGGCTPCQSGTFSTQLGATVCKFCAGGTYSSLVGTTSCQNCSAGNYSAVAASACLQCADGYSSSEASTVCTKLPPCSDGYYGLNPKCIQCPTNTNSSFNRTFTILDCKCLPGFVCTYTKRISVVLTFKNLSWEMLQVNLTTLSRSAVMDAIAAAAGVSRENVHIHGVFPGRRRLLAGDPADGTNRKMFITVSGAEGLDVETVYSLLGSMNAHVAWEHKHTLSVMSTENYTLL